MSVRNKKHVSEIHSCAYTYAEDDSGTAGTDYQEDGFDELYPDELSMLRQNSDIPNKVVKL